MSVQPRLTRDASPKPWLGVQGQLFAIDRPGGGNTGGRWFADEADTHWFVKADMLHVGLQTSAEVVAARVLAHFGYPVPETHKLVRGGVHLSAARDVGEALETTRFEALDTPAVRELRIVAAYLKDWDRVAPRTHNNLVHADGSVSLIDFGGTLGSRALGEHKPGVVCSPAIGAFEAATELDAIWDDYTVEVAPDHPWLHLDRGDVERALTELERLDDERIAEIVEAAGYPGPEDSVRMNAALRARRDTLVRQLPRRFPG